jgi:hypothetical protein
MPKADAPAKRVEVRPSPINGVGVFALVDFAAGDVITREDDSFVVTPDNPVPPGEHEYHCDWYADGRQVLLRAPERHYNHSCEFNSLKVHIDGVRHTIARRDIKAGEEITHNYCIDGFGDTAWQCNCGSAQCRKTLHSDFFHLPLALQIEYLPYLSDLYKRVFADKVAALKREAAIA